MGLFDFLGGGTEEQRLERLIGKATQKFGPPENRQKALEQLSEMGTPGAILGLLKRFTITAEPGITDREEKDYVYRTILDAGQDAVEPLKSFVRNSETAITWALKGLTALIPPPELSELCIQVLQRLGPDYTRDPEKKVVLLTHLLEMNDEGTATAVLPFLEDPADDVKLAAAKILARSKDEAVRKGLCEALIRESGSKRVVAGFVEALATAGFGVQGFEAKLTELVQEPFYVDKKDHVVKRRA